MQSKKPKLIIRADANPIIGIGHVMRCIALAQLWKREKGEIIFLSECPPSIADRITSSGFDLVHIQASLQGVSAIDATIACIKAEKPDWFVLDGYHFTHVLQKAIRSAGTQLLILDDYNHLSFYDADILLNQTPKAWQFEYKTPHDTFRLMGSRFTMLRDEFVSADYPPPSPSHDKASNILVTMGGADPENVTGKIIQSIDLIPNKKLNIKLLLGPTNPHYTAINHLLSSSGRHYEIITDTTDMPRLLLWAHMAISAGGSTAWELSYFGIPAIYIITSENQKAIVTELSDSGAGINGGWHQKINIKILSDQIIRLLKSPSARNRMAKNGKALVDGKGRQRVVLAMKSCIGKANLKITLISDQHSWVKDHLNELENQLIQQGHRLTIADRMEDIPVGDVVFCLGFGQLVPGHILKKNTHNLVVHESALPKGKGWSPLTWQILEGKKRIPISLIEAERKVDNGCIYLQEYMSFVGHELVDELRQIQWMHSMKLCLKFISEYPKVLANARFQKGPGSYYPRRIPEDSKLDANKNLRDQFNLMRVADNQRYPLFFEMHGNQYQLSIKKRNKSS